MNRHVFQQVCLLSESFTTVFAPKRLLPGVGSQVHLDVGLVEEAPVAYLTVVHHLLALVPLAAWTSSTSSTSTSLLTTAAKKALEKGIESKAFRDKCSFFMQIKLEYMRDQTTSR